MTLPLHGFPDWQRSLQTADLVALNVNQVVNAATNFSTAVFDMRPYSSFSIDAFARTVALGFAYQRVDFTVLWGDDNTMANIVYMDTYSIFAEGNGSVAFPSLNGRFQLQDAVHGPWMQLIVGNYGSQQCNTTTRVFGNSRALGRRYVQNLNSVGAFQVDNLSSLLFTGGQFINAGANIDILLRMAPGPVSWNFLAGAVSSMVFAFLTPSNENVYSETVVAGAAVPKEFSFPRTALRLNVANVGAGANNFAMQVVSKRDNW